MRHEPLRVTSPLMVKIVSRQAAAIDAESRIGLRFFALQRVTHFLQQVSQCFGFKTALRA